MTKISLPLFVMIPRKTKPDRKVILNLNVYRNLHHRTEHQAKKLYTAIVLKKLSGKKFKTPINLIFTYYKPTARKSDRANVLCIHEKYFCDTMVQSGCIEDDNDNYIQSSFYVGGEIDRVNPRVEVTIDETS